MSGKATATATAMGDGSSVADDVVRDISTFASGEYPGDKPGEVWKYSDPDIAEIAKNFQLLSSGEKPLHRVPVAVTHDGVYAHGWVTDARQKGDKLKTDWEHVSPDLRKDVKKKRLRKVSAEIKENFTDKDGKVFPGKYLYRVTALGAAPPRVKGLDDIPASQFADSTPGRVITRDFCSGDDETHRAADTGASIMDRAAAIQVLTDAGLDPALISDSDSDELIQAMAMLVQGGDEPSEDRGQFDDADEEEERRIATGSGKTYDYGDGIDEDIDPATGLPRVKKAAMGDLHTPRGTRRMPQQQQRPQPKRTVSIRQFSDAVNVAAKIIRREVAKGTQKIAAATAAEVKAREARETENRIDEVRKFCDRMAGEHRISPAENDEGSPLTERSQLVLMARQPQATHEFADPADTTGVKKVRKTLLQLRQEKLAAQPPRMFSERVKSGGSNGQTADPFGDRVDAHYKREMERLNARGGAASRN